MTAYEGYERLKDKAVIQAAQDLENDFREISRCIGDRERPIKKRILCDALSIFDFFHGKWYQALTNVNGEYLVSRVVSEFNKKAKKHGRKEINVENLIQLALYSAEESDKLKCEYFEKLKKIGEQITNLRKFHEGKVSEYDKGAYKAYSDAINLINSFIAQTQMQHGGGETCDTQNDTAE